jgi:hypothetical protein
MKFALAVFGGLFQAISHSIIMIVSQTFDDTITLIPHQVMLDLKKRFTELRRRENHLRYAIIALAIIACLLLIPLLGFSGHTQDYVAFAFYLIWFPLYYTITGIISIVVGAQFLNKLKMLQMRDESSTKVATKVSQLFIGISLNNQFLDLKNIYSTSLGFHGRVPNRCAIFSSQFRIGQSSLFVSWKCPLLFYSPLWPLLRSLDGSSHSLSEQD